MLYQCVPASGSFLDAEAIAEAVTSFAAKPVHLRTKLPLVLEDAEQKLSPRLRWLLPRVWQEWQQVEIEIKAFTDEIKRISNEEARCRRLRQTQASARWYRLPP